MLPSPSQGSVIALAVSQRPHGGHTQHPYSDTGDHRGPAPALLLPIHPGEREAGVSLGSLEGINRVPANTAGRILTDDQILAPGTLDGKQHPAPALLSDRTAMPSLQQGQSMQPAWARGMEVAAA